MAIPLTFLEASNGLPLRKTLTKDGTIPYPRVKKMNSHSHFVGDNRDGLTELFDLFRDHAAAGHAFLKGNLKKPLENESRAGQTDKYALTQLLVIDIDGLPLDGLPRPPFTQDDVVEVAQRVLTYLPEPLQHASCVAHAGSSFGVVKDRVSMHLIFMLSRPVGPEGLKEWLINLNFQNAMLSELLTLTPQNVSIKYIIDPVLAHNTHLLLIADPKFDGLKNTFETNRDRWVLLDNGPVSIDLIPLLSDVCPQENQLKIEKKLNELRKAKGLQKFKPKMRTMVGYTGEKIQVVSNPDALRIEYAYENDEFVYFNVNGGDSNAYFCPKHNPDIVYNFKNEPPFEMARANPAIYEWYLEKYAEVIRERSGTLPVAFRDFASDKHYAVLVNPAEDAIERMAEIQKHNLEDWMAEQGRSVPDPIPTWDIEFDPHSDVVYDPYKKRINTFQLSPLLRNPPAILEKYHCTLGTAGDALKELCPTIGKIIWSICGNRDTEFEYFLNWFAAALQLRRKLTTAWVFSGVPGTGKGLFYDHILCPLIGEQYARRKRIDHLEDKFDSHMAQTLFTVYDEFRLSDSKEHSKTLNKIKDEITAETGEIRAMRQESVVRRLFSNYLFFSNHNDALRIEEGDRRFNIAPPQMRKLVARYPGIDKEIPRIEDELPAFASFLSVYVIDERAARTCLENDAKEAMKRSAMGWHEQFCLALRTGDLDYFLDDILEASASANTQALYQQLSARKIVEAWAAEAADGAQSDIAIHLLHDVYNSLAPQEATRKKFTALLNRNDVNVERMTIEGERQRGVSTRFFSKSYTPDELRNLLDQRRQKDTFQCPTTTH